MAPNTIGYKKPMTFYKLESTFRYKTNFGKYTRKTIHFYYKNFDRICKQLRYELSIGAKCAVKEISEKEYMRGIKSL
jgi:hypothetical protein